LRKILLMPAKDFLDLEEKKNLQKALKEEERAEVM
jgi:hypothetical protein